MTQGQGLDLTDFFTSDTSAETVSSVEELRLQLREYNSAKALSDSAGTRVSEAKGKILELFKDLPNEYKATKALTPKDVAGRTFAREEKTITVDGSVIIVRDKVNTKSPRDKYLKELREKAAKADTVAAREAYEDAIATFEGHLDPTKGTEMKIEPVKTG